MTAAARTSLHCCPVAAAAERYGDTPAIFDGGGVTSFDDLDDRVASAAAFLSTAGVDVGDVIGLDGANNLPLLIAFLAIRRLGAVAAMLPSRYPSSAHADMLARVDANLFLTDRKDEPAVSDTTPVLSIDECRASTTMESLPGPPKVGPDQPAVIVFTSGSSGPPKPALLSHGNLVYSAIGANRAVHLGRGDRWLLSLPLYHVGGIGIVFRCLLSGAAIACGGAGRALAERVETLDVSHVSVVATQLRRLLDAGVDLSGLKTVLAGGGPIPSHLRVRCRESGVPLVTTYGLTEMSSQVTTAAQGDSLGAAGCGSVLPFRSVRIGSAGEILVRGETLFLGYMESGSVTSSVNNEGWFHTRDRGRFDPSGALIVEGRLDSMFISGGENIYPEEIERVISEMAGVARSVVVDVPDPEFGARPVAFIEYDGSAIPTEEVMRFLEERLPRHKLPLAVFEMPASADVTLSKPGRSHLRRVAVENLGRG